jgi:hypothetical protein
VETWHPILAAVEGPTGTWRMLDSLGRPYGTIEIRRVMNGTDTRYRVSFRGEVIGWATTLQLACEQIHRAFLRAHGPSGGPIAGWGRRERDQPPKNPTPRSG